MTPYYIMVALPVILTVVMGKNTDSFSNERKNKIISWAFFLIVLMLLMLRHQSIGTDLSIYIGKFNFIKKLDFNEVFKEYDSERGYYLLNKIISLFTENEQEFTAIVAVICVLPVAGLYARESKNALLTISIFLVGSNFDMLFSGLRQSIAIAIIAFGFRFVKNKKLLPYIVCVLLAFTFHKSALVAILIYLFYHMNFTRAKIIAMIPIIGGVFVFRNQIFEFALNFLGEYGETYQLEETTGYSMIILFFLFLIFSFMAAEEENMDKTATGYRNIMLLATMFQIFALASPVAMRMNYYNITLVPLVIPAIIDKSSNNNKDIYRWVGGILTAFFIVFYFYRAMTGMDIMELYPYRLFTEK